MKEGLQSIEGGPVPPIQGTGLVQGTSIVQEAGGLLEESTGAEDLNEQVDEGEGESGDYPRGMHRGSFPKGRDLRDFVAFVTFS